MTAPIGSTVLATLAVLALVGGAPLASGAPPATPHRIGVLDVVATAANEANLAAFRQGLRELGYEVIP